MRSCERIRLGRREFPARDQRIDLAAEAEKRDLVRELEGAAGAGEQFRKLKPARQRVIGAQKPAHALGGRDLDIHRETLGQHLHEILLEREERQAVIHPEAFGRLFQRGEMVEVPLDEI